MSDPTPTQASSPITHGGTERGYKVCKCSQCSVEELCTPSRDFYTTDSPTGLLLCETCFWNRAEEQLNTVGSRGATVVLPKLPCPPTNKT